MHVVKATDLWSFLIGSYFINLKCQKSICKECSKVALFGLVSLQYLLIANLYFNVLTDLSLIVSSQRRETALNVLQWYRLRYDSNSLLVAFSYSGFYTFPKLNSKLIRWTDSLLPLFTYRVSGICWTLKLQ